MANRLRTGYAPLWTGSGAQVRQSVGTLDRVPTLFVSLEKGEQMSETRHRERYADTRVLIEKKYVLNPTFPNVTLTLGGGQVEMLRNLTQYLSVRSTFVDEYKVGYYFGPTDSDWDSVGAIVADLEDMLMSGDSVARGCRVLRRSVQTISHATLTVVVYNDELYDEDDCWSGTHPTKLFAGRNGFYMAGASIMIDLDVATRHRALIQVRKNGSRTLASQKIMHHNTAGAKADLTISTGMFWLVSGDYVEMLAYHNTGVAEAISAATNTHQEYNSAWLARIA